jgi:hypothetical protein
VNAWPAPLRTHTHHSGPMWIATPSSYETFTHCHLAGFHRRTNTRYHDLQNKILAHEKKSVVPKIKSSPIKNFPLIPKQNRRKQKKFSCI